LEELRNKAVPKGTANEQASEFVERDDFTGELRNNSERIVLHEFMGLAKPDKSGLSINQTCTKHTIPLMPGS